MLDALLKHRLIYVDSNILIYFVEKSSERHRLVHHILQACQRQQLKLVSSELAMAECRVGSLRQGHEGRDLAFFDFFSVQNSCWSFAPLTKDILWAAPEVGMDFGLDLADALHFATALDLGCDAFLTNDKGFTSGEPLPQVYQLKDFD